MKLENVEFPPNFFICQCGGNRIAKRKRYAWMIGGSDHRDDRKKIKLTASEPTAGPAGDRTRNRIGGHADQAEFNILGRPLDNAANKSIDTTGHNTRWIGRIKGTNPYSTHEDVFLRFIVCIDISA
jgi:hypothetical protein